MCKWLNKEDDISRELEVCEGDPFSGGARGETRPGQACDELDRRSRRPVLAQEPLRTREQRPQRTRKGGLEDGSRAGREPESDAHARVLCARARHLLLSLVRFREVDVAHPTFVFAPGPVLHFVLR